MEDFLESIGEWIGDLVSDWFGGNFYYKLGVGVWDWAMSLIFDISSTSPVEFSTTAWSYVANDVYLTTSAIGASLLNIFFMVGIIRQSTNLKDNFTLEMMVDNLLKMLLGNMLIVKGIDLMKQMFDISKTSAKIFLINQKITFSQTDRDIGSFLFNYVFGMVFCIVCVVCAFTIFLTVYSRYLQLYLLVATYPLAMSTLPGGHGVNATASSWLRAFLGKTFEIVVIAIAISVASKMCNAIDFGAVKDKLGSNFDGAIQVVQSMATMVILTGAVKGVDTFMHRALGL